MGAGGGSNDVTLIRVDGQSNNHIGSLIVPSLDSPLSIWDLEIKMITLSIFSDNQQAGTQIEAVTVLQDGKVGIGSVIPAGKLDVDGNIFPVLLTLTILVLLQKDGIIFLQKILMLRVI